VTPLVTSGCKLDKNGFGWPKNLQIPEKRSRKWLFGRFVTLYEPPSAAIKPTIVTIEPDAFGRRELSVTSCHPIFLTVPLSNLSSVMTTASDRDTILELTQKLLVCIIDGDWETYTELCCPTLTCFEPEALGNLVDGLEFHQYYFNLPSTNSNSAPLPVQAKIVAPHVRVMGDVAIIAYVRLTQKMADGKPITVAMEETRVWHRQQGKWKHVHFHRSPAR